MGLKEHRLKHKEMVNRAIEVLGAAEAAAAEQAALVRQKPAPVTKHEESGFLEGFLKREAFAGIPWWKALLGGAGGLAVIGIGYKYLRK